jgi:short chain dehydrogenase
MAGPFHEKVAIVTGGGRGSARPCAGSWAVAARERSSLTSTPMTRGGWPRPSPATAGGLPAAPLTWPESRTSGVWSRTPFRLTAVWTTCSTNAGIGIGGDARYLTLDHWRRVLDVDLYGVVHGVVAAYPVMARQGFGHIVNTSSSAAFFPVPANAPYGTAKRAVVGLSLSLRLEAAELGVKVSCVCPGFVRTNIYRNAVSVNPSLRAGVSLEELAGAPAKMMQAAGAAELILDGWHATTR